MGVTLATEVHRDAGPRAVIAPEAAEWTDMGLFLTIPGGSSNCTGAMAFCMAFGNSHCTAELATGIGPLGMEESEGAVS